MVINVHSEIGKLKSVLVHRPGKEVERVYPDIFERILFDDIMFLQVAQKEHDDFVKHMENEGVKVYYIEKLVAQVLDQDPKLREKFVDGFLSESGIISQAVYDAAKGFLLKHEDNLELVRATIAGIKKSEIHPEFSSSIVDQEAKESDYPFYVDPIPNIMFQRDPIASVFHSTNLHNMWSKTRKREKIYYEYGFKLHPDFKDIDYIMTPEDKGFMEGGDVLVVSDKQLLVGIGERTSGQAVEVFAQKLFQKHPELDSILGVKIPKSHATMHLDTVLTHVDHNKFIISPDVLKGDCRFFVMKSDPETKQVVYETKMCPIKDMLEEFLHKDVKLIEVGAGDVVRAKREQWNDATNSLCLEPGKVIVYERNTITNRSLQEAGIQTIEIESEELSKGRGGPRCMTMPLEREHLNS